MTRYVPADLEQVGAELSRRAAEVADWLDEDAARSPVAGNDALSTAIAQVDRTCAEALSDTARRLACAADSLAASARTAREGDAGLAALMRRTG